MTTESSRTDEEEDSSVREKSAKNLEKCEIMTLAIYEQLPFITTQVDNSTDEVQAIALEEKSLAHGMCVPVRFKKVPFGEALIDQGATKTIIRQTALSKRNYQPRIMEVKNMYVLSSSGKTLPVKGCFPETIYSDNMLIGKTLVYIVANTKENDIVCDLVLGRATLANGEFPCIDMRNSGSLYSTSHNMRIKCLPCKFSTDHTGQVQLTPIHIDVPRKISDSEQEYENTSYNEKETNMMSDSTVDEQEEISLNILKTYVEKNEKLSKSEKQLLYRHLVENRDKFTVVSENIELQEESNDILKNELMLYNFMCDMDKCEKGSETETRVISTFMNMYVPTTVQKDSALQRRKAEENENDIIRDVEDIEFPYTPPTMKDNSSAYQKEKRREIRKRIYAISHLSDEQKHDMYKLLKQHADRFSLRGENMERTDTVQHEIDTGVTHPFRERVRQYSPAIQSIIDDEVLKMLKEGVIVPSKSAYASNLLLVRKPDPSSEGGVKNRVCASFVRLNSNTEKDSYPLPGIQYIYDKIGKSTWFTTMDLLSGFWQVMIKPEHRYKTAFITMRGLYEFVVMPFGLCNAPATFQRLMDAVILPEYRDFIETYIDDLMTHSMTFEDHIKHLDILFKQLRKHKLVVKLTKCKFAQLEVKFLGHIISQNKLKTNPEAVETVKKWQRPTGTGKKAVSAIRGFLGTVNWYRKFIPNCADLQRPLINLTKKSVVFEWSKECQESFEKLRDALISAPVLMIADANKHYILHTDASDYAMGAILMQEDENSELHPIAYASKTFNDAQKNYDTTDREALAVVWALEHFNTYCEGHKYTLITDHQALSYIHSNKDSKKRIHRLALKLANYDVKLYYKPGKENHMADLLSRNLMDTKNDVVKSVMKNDVQHDSVSSEVQSGDVKSSVKSDITASIHFQGAHTRKKQKTKASKEEYEVEKIVDKRPCDGRDDEYEYKVRWKGYGDNDDTWESTQNLQHALKLIIDYEKEMNKKKKDKKSTDTKKSKYLPDIRVCDICTKSFVNDSAYYIHCYHEHGIAVPAAVLSHMDMTTNIKVFQSLQASEPQFRAIYNTELGTSDYTQLDKNTKRMLDQHEFVVSDNDLLYCVEIPISRTRSKVRTQLRLCIPKTERLRILHKYHNENAHSGISRLYEKLCDKVWWPSMLRDVVSYVRSCELCQKSKGNVNKIKTRPMGLPTRPWSHIHFDHVGPLPLTDGGNVYILTVIDRFTRYAEAFAITEEQFNTNATAKILVEKIICRYGIPDVVASDRGPVVVGMVLNQVFKLLGIRRVKTTAHHAQSNGVVEIFNKTLKTSLRIWANENQKDWDEYIAFALFAYNTSFHSILRETPYYLNHGRQAKDITDELTESDYYRNASIHAYAKELTDKLFKTHQRVRELLEQVNEKREKEIENEECIKFEVGDQVLLYDPTTPQGVSRKLVKRWLGPYAIIEKHSDVVYTIMRDDPHQQQKVNVKRLRLFKDFVDIKSMTNEQETDLEIAIREVNALSNEILSLQERKQLIASTHNIDESKMTEQNSDDVNVTHINSLAVKRGVIQVSVEDMLVW